MMRGELHRQLGFARHLEEARREQMNDRRCENPTEDGDDGDENNSQGRDPVDSSIAAALPRFCKV